MMCSYLMTRLATSIQEADLDLLSRFDTDRGQPAVRMDQFPQPTRPPEPLGAGRMDQP
jgi:hypothetical protein